MEITKTLYVKNRHGWRTWLAKNYNKAPEIWLIYYKKDSGKPRIPYHEAVEEALCFGWIDSTAKKIDEQRFAQRFSPRRPTSQLSELNKERIRRLIKQRKMTKAGLKAIEHVWVPTEVFKTPVDILKALKQDKQVWQNWQAFPAPYQRIRMGFVEGARNRPAEFSKRLNYLLRMTKQNKQFGMVK